MGGMYPFVGIQIPISYQHAWTVREAPLEAIADEDWEPGRDIDFSADYEVWPAGSPRLQCRLYGVLRDANCPRKAAYDQIAGTIRRQA